MFVINFVQTRVKQTEIGPKCAKIVVLNNQMGSLEKFCLRWGEQGANVAHSFGNLRKKGQLFDVTISTDDDDEANTTANLLAHKVILSACSDFFR